MEYNIFRSGFWEHRSRCTFQTGVDRFRYFFLILPFVPEGGNNVNIKQTKYRDEERFQARSQDLMIWSV